MDKKRSRAIRLLVEYWIAQRRGSLENLEKYLCGIKSGTPLSEMEVGYGLGCADCLIMKKA